MYISFGLITVNFSYKLYLKMVFSSIKTDSFIWQVPFLPEMQKIAKKTVNGKQETKLVYNSVYVKAQFAFRSNSNFFSFSCSNKIENKLYIVRSYGFYFLVLLEKEHTMSSPQVWVLFKGNQIQKFDCQST